MIDYFIFLHPHLMKRMAITVCKHKDSATFASHMTLLFTSE